ncbi:hypothetical protein VNO77_40199 [Canavalia gladiata]|uniref:Legume lectin domain-containing protein n=1 Tax=Canavalia gladiata TaxID=3824 RepID=A0AAN9PR05_CANGL
MHHHNMAFPNSKSFQNLLSVLLIKIFIPFLLLQYNTVNSQQSPLAAYETINFGFSGFSEEDPNIGLIGDASASGGILRLTKTDSLGKPIPHSVGRAMHITPIHLWNKNNGELADFTSYFSFVVNTNGSTLHGDGLAFFIAPFDNIHIPKNSSGGYLGLFSPDTALEPNKNQILAIEFDSFTNDWDPNPRFQSPHIGIDVGSIESVVSVAWPIEFEPGNAIVHASLNYNSEDKTLSVFVVYPTDNRNATLSTIVDLRTILPEYVRVGFSASTGDLVETHQIISWSFEAAL